uniref:Uncharacterized protein n=1 Tax=Amphimedon queenslandica TaxID=400682 RepID=A0A1X7V0S4_AMPQE
MLWTLMTMQVHLIPTFIMKVVFLKLVTWKMCAFNLVPVLIIQATKGNVLKIKKQSTPCVSTPLKVKAALNFGSATSAICTPQFIGSTPAAENMHNGSTVKKLGSKESKMGKRKLCFDVRKNVERHKRQRILQESSTEQSLILCNPIEVTHMNGQSLEPVTIDKFHTVTGQVLWDTIEPRSSLVVTIPLQLIFTLHVPNLSFLMKLIREPFGCQVTYVVGPGGIILSLSFHKKSDWFPFVITINHNFT